MQVSLSTYVLKDNIHITNVKDRQDYLETSKIIIAPDLVMDRNMDRASIRLPCLTRDKIDTSITS